jgi:hypothetical protein
MAFSPSLRPGAASLALAAALALAGAPRLGAAAPALSPLQKLVIENDIRQQIILYGLLADGDGISHKDVRTLADKTLMPDVVTDIVLPNGQNISHTITSEAVVASTPKPVDRPAAGRHFMVSTYFDAVTPTTAKTRTTTLYIEAIKDTGPGCETQGPDACGGRVTHAVTLVYHDSWKKTPDGWKKIKSTLYRDN